LLHVQAYDQNLWRVAFSPIEFVTLRRTNHL
jgi:hypothetical protein